MKLILDRMLGKMRVWLRLCGYDTLYIGELDVDMDEDEFLLMRLKERVLVTRDRELYRKSIRRGREAVLIEGNDLRSQLVELKEKLSLTFEPVMQRCSLCNSLLRKPSKEEAVNVIRRENFPDGVMDLDLFYCEKCDKLYWRGSHWDNILEFISGLNSR